MSLPRMMGRILPWIITFVALYYAFRGVDWRVLISHIGDAEVAWLMAAFSLTVISYLLRTNRWKLLFPEQVIIFNHAFKALMLGFFMNNVLPARAGELVRAHCGARLTGLKRTLVLATIASERLIDGLTISIMFVVFALGVGDSSTSSQLLLVAGFFVLACVFVVFTVFVRDHLFSLAKVLHERVNNKVSHFTLDRFQIFINGLTPLSSKAKLPKIVAWSILIWAVELGVYQVISMAFGAKLPLAQAVLFLVAVNFSSLIPAAPGGIGVIEAIASAVLVSLGISKELALTMVITQHVIQYFVVGIPGALVLLSWKKSIPDMYTASNEIENGIGTVYQSQD